MSIQKKKSTKPGVSNVIFALPETAVEKAKRIAIVGDFNNWNPNKHLMKKTNNGNFERKIELHNGKEYQFRYLIDEDKWENEPEADGFAETPYPHTYNSVIKLTSLR